MTGIAVYLADLLAAAGHVGLVAIGFALVYRVTGHLHFAYAGIWTLISYVFGSRIDAGDPMAAAFLYTLAVALLLSFVCLFVYRRLRGEFTLILASFGIYLMLMGIQLVIWGPSQTGIGGTSILSGVWNLALGEGEVSIVVVSVAHVAAVAVVALGLAYVLGRTRLGGEAIAISEDRTLAAVTGIQVSRIELAAYAASALLATLSAAIQVAATGSDVFTGTELFFEALIVVIIAGKVIVGVVLAALVFGAVSAGSQELLGTEWVTLATYTILLLLIMWKPTGFLVQDLFWRSRGSAWPRGAAPELNAARGEGKP